ncbi:MAG: hypothetical protein GXO48_07805, partial [Chlorobi bacterium]|nr:hypothetical protein [Chlorobiota bacterium]
MLRGGILKGFFLKFFVFFVANFTLIVYSQKTGIGTSTPQARFHINVPSAFNDSLFMISQGSAIKLVLTQSGKLGIGTGVPSAELHVVGSARITGLGGSGNALVLSDNQGNLYVLALPNDTTKFLRGDGTWKAISVSGGDNWGSQVALTSGALTGSGVVGDSIRLKSGTAVGQVWKWDGGKWVLAKDSVGDNWGSQVVQVNGPLTGDGTSANPLGLISGTNAGDVLKWDGSQWVS